MGVGEPRQEFRKEHIIRSGSFKFAFHCSLGVCRPVIIRSIRLQTDLAGGAAWSTEVNAAIGVLGHRLEQGHPGPIRIV
jgi:hypothetical protein